MIEAIGGNITTEAQSLDNSAINQEEFIELFLAQLTNQDPMEPVDNSQFLAQMAQFTSLEQSRLLNENMTNLLTMGTSDQSLSLLGRTVQIDQRGVVRTGTVNEINYGPQGTSLNITVDGTTLSDISIADVRIVR